MTSVTRSRIKNILKAVVTIAIFAVVLRRVSVADLLKTLGTLRGRDWLVLTLLTVAQVSVGVLRWRRLLHHVGERVKFLPLYGDVLVGLTYNMFLPTTVGGDVIRALRARGRVLVTHHAWSTSIYERIAGLLAMAASGALAALIGATLTDGIPMGVRYLAASVTVVLVAIFFGASTPFRLLVKLLERRIPPVAARDMNGIVADLEGPLAKRACRLEALAWSLLYQALGIVFVVVGAHALGDSSHDLAVLVGVPLVHVLSMIPITIGGLGLREGLFVGILGKLGMAPAIALGLAAQWLLSSLAFALGGAIVTLVDAAKLRHEQHET